MPQSCVQCRVARLAQSEAVCNVKTEVGVSLPRLDVMGSDVLFGATMLALIAIALKYRGLPLVCKVAGLIFWRPALPMGVIFTCSGLAHTFQGTKPLTGDAITERGAAYVAVARLVLPHRIVGTLASFGQVLIQVGMETLARAIFALFGRVTLKRFSTMLTGVVHSVIIGDIERCGKSADEDGGPGWIPLAVTG